MPSIARGDSNTFGNDGGQGDLHFQLNQSRPQIDIGTVLTAVEAVADAVNDELCASRRSFQFSASFHFFEEPLQPKEPMPLLFCSQVILLPDVIANRRRFQPLHEALVG